MKDQQPPIRTTHNPYAYSEPQIIEMCALYAELKWADPERGQLLVFTEPTGACNRPCDHCYPKQREEA